MTAATHARALRRPITLRDRPLTVSRADSRQNTVLMPGRVGHPQDAETGGRPDRCVCTPVDMRT